MSPLDARENGRPLRVLPSLKAVFNIDNLCQLIVGSLTEVHEHFTGGVCGGLWSQGWWSRGFVVGGWGSWLRTAACDLPSERTALQMESRVGRYRACTRFAGRQSR